MPASAGIPAHDLSELARDRLKADTLPRLEGRGLCRFSHGADKGRLGEQRIPQSKPSDIPGKKVAKRWTSGNAATGPSVAVPAATAIMAEALSIKSHDHRWRTGWRCDFCRHLAPQLSTAAGFSLDHNPLTPRAGRPQHFWSQAYSPPRAPGGSRMNEKRHQS